MNNQTNKTNKIITKRPNGLKRVVTMPVGNTRAQKQFKEECDVNNIIAKYRKTGSITHVRNAEQGVYMDLTELPSLMEAQKVVIAAATAFESVPSHIRQRFSHDPQQFIDFLSDPKNNEEAIKLGLKTKKENPPPDPILNELKNLNKNLNQKPKSKPKSSETET